MAALPSVKPLGNLANQNTTQQAQKQQTSAPQSTPSVNMNTDYKALMNEADARGDLASAAKYEQQRNAKIDEMNRLGTNKAGHQKTNLYASYLPTTQTVAQPTTTPTVNMNTDYKALMNDADNRGDLASAALYEQQRNAKIDELNRLGKNTAGHQKTYQYAAYLPQQKVEDPNRITAADIEALYQKMQQQQEASIDYAVQQNVDALQRAQEDAQKGFRQQRDQVNIDEAQARDKQVLYAAARGDRGGITARQYDSISNTASNNRRAIAEQQQQLATDTARQIADLRAKGEFEKANAVLEIAQQQIAKLWELQQYEDERELQQKQLAMSEANLTGVYNGHRTLAAQQAKQEWDYNTKQAEKEWAYQVAMQSIQSGVMPTSDILATAGLDSNVAKNMVNVYKASLTAKKSSGSGSRGGSGSGSGGGKEMTLANAKLMAEEGIFTDQVLNAFHKAGFTDEYLSNHYGYGFKDEDGGYRSGLKLDQFLGDGTSNGGKTSFNWNQDEGIFTWNGKNYYKVDDLLAAMEKANFTPSEWSTIQKKFKLFGFDITSD